jgi:hypothetical protein
MQHVVDSRSGQHVGNRDYTPRSEYFAVVGGGGGADAVRAARRSLAIAIGLDGHARRAAAPEDRKFLWPTGPRPAGQPGLSELSL